MAKNKFVTEFEVNASTKMLFPYLSTASGLAQWFAEDVNINEDKVYSFLWDGEEHKATKAAQKTNHFVKFEFLPETEEDEGDPTYIELRLMLSELTQSVFLQITDYSDLDDPEEQQDLWENIVHSLKELIGG
ncbi:MAG: ATPase [Cytophagales bacterium CG12_big_fil_rev_8_21_14_0_65_40_12]|uniref:START-like domain-containing protein n=1 Tax=Roseivirga sp. TaxID=1964215 RepID=UPI000C3F72C5|nr:MAG: ATPase [Cytophagales bacterium CG12_big_fil_rev_8_21_14_0_65_40_12]PIW05627.1 MAG: ATPase [Cytophagales bacterium CG17_big_fil_post_rev_8_21_14_2_50_40_13]